MLHNFVLIDCFPDQMHLCKSNEVSQQVVVAKSGSIVIENPQEHNILAFPGIFKGTLENRAKQITPQMKLAAAYAIADYVTNPTREVIILSSLDMTITGKVAEAVKNACNLTHHVAH